MTADTTHGDHQAIYRRKLCSVRAAVDQLRADDTIAAPIATGQPAAFLNALAERTDWRNLTVFSGLLIEPYAVLQQPGVRLISGFYGPVERLMKTAGANIDYLPADFLGWERYAHLARPRVMVSALAPMDDDGFLSFGLHAGATFNSFLAAARDPQRLAIGEIVRDMPRVFGLDAGDGNRIHISEIDCIVESDRSAFVLPEVSATEEDHAIAQQVEALIGDGATLQIGIGSVPNIVAERLAAGRKGDFGIHREMFVDGIMRLHQAGKVTNRKGINDGVSVATFAAGSKALYRWMDRNREVLMLPVALVNDPGIIAQNRRMVSINGALAVDLAGQIMADAIGPRQYSGVGGHELFVMGARNSDDGKSIVCLRSTATVDGQVVSTIAPELPVGTRVTTPRHHVQFIVTEHGTADLGMLTDAQRIEALIQIAHPNFRDVLRAGARGG